MLNYKIQGRKMKNITMKCLCIFTIIFVTGCATNNSMYTWGQYENLIYEFHLGEGSIEPQKQIEILQETIALAVVEDKKVGPGIYAHLGMLYSSVGETDKALAALEQERILFPESEIFINGMLKRSQSNQ